MVCEQLYKQSTGPAENEGNEAVDHRIKERESLGANERRCLETEE